MTASQSNQNEKRTNKQQQEKKQKQMFCIVEGFMLMNHMNYISKGWRGKKKDHLKATS